jgi:hypothetical protein
MRISYLAAEVFGGACGFKRSFCTRHDSISATMMVLGFRQSIM